jgi:hypothetical protein
VIWTDSLAHVVGAGIVAVTIIWLGYAFTPVFLRRTVIRNQPDAARVSRAAVIQFFVLSWVWILHGALAAWLLVSHEWWVVWGLVVVLMAAVGRTSYRALTRFEEIDAAERHPRRQDQQALPCACSECRSSAT